MQIFQKANPEKQLADKLATKTAERDKLAGRLADATAAVIAATSAVTQLAVDGADDPALDGAETRLRALSDRATTLTSALLAAEAAVATFARDLSAHQDTVQRAATATEIEVMAHDLEKLTSLSDELFSKITKIAERGAAAQIWDANGLLSYAVATKCQLPAAIELVVRSYRERRDRVLDGRSPSTLTAPATARVVVAVKEPVVTRLLATKNVCWTDDEGKSKSAAKYNIVDLPPATAARALASDACREIGSELWKMWGNTRALSTPPISECTSLDADSADIPQRTDTPSDPRFQRVDRGPPITLHLPREA
jgi:hypothetical protein